MLDARYSMFKIPLVPIFRIVAIRFKVTAVMSSYRLGLATKLTDVVKAISIKKSAMSFLVFLDIKRDFKP